MSPEIFGAPKSGGIVGAVSRPHTPTNLVRGTESREPAGGSLSSKRRWSNQGRGCDSILGENGSDDPDRRP